MHNCYMCPNIKVEIKMAWQAAGYKLTGQTWLNAMGLTSSWLDVVWIWVSAEDAMYAHLP